MHLDYIITQVDVGGVTQVVSLLECLKRRNHTPRLISLLPPLAFKERLSRAGIPIHSLNMRSKFDTPLALLRLLRLLKSSPPDILHAHCFHANILARMAHPFLPKLKILCTAHNTYEVPTSYNKAQKTFLRDWAYRLTNPLSDLNTTISEAVRQRLIGDKVFPADKTQTIFNGIDLDQFHPVTEPQDHALKRDFLWLAVGRLVKQKDYATLLDALTHLNGGRLSIAGDGPLRSELESQARHNGLASRATFLGSRDDIPALYRIADGFVLSSEFEGYGLVVAEAMASGLPVVVTDSGGPTEIVGADEQAGYVVPIKNPKALATAMTRVMALSPTERRRMGQIGRQRVQRFCLDAITDQWESTYAALLAR
jgi:glycosyltransferase involved in cell wall biosynthesis